MTNKNPRFKTAIYEQYARIGKAVSNPSRLELLDLLCQSPRTVEALTKEADLGLTNVSQQLEVLREARLVEAEKSGLFVFNDPPYGTERSYNALRLASSLAKGKDTSLSIFLIGEAVGCALSLQSTPDGYYNIERMLKFLTSKGHKIGVCGSCIDARGIKPEALAHGAHRSSMDELTRWTGDANKLTELLGVPAVPTVARSGHGKEALMEAAVQKAKESRSSAPLVISYGDDLDLAIADMEMKIRAGNFLTDRYPARWVALKLLENDEQIIEVGRKHRPELAADLEKTVQKVSTHLLNTLDTEPEALISDHRYGYIHALLKQGVIRRAYDQNRLYTSDKADRFLTHRLLGPLVMLAVVMVLYKFTFTYSETPLGWVEGFFGWLGDLASAHLPEGLFKSLVISGIIDGVGGVMGFVPLIMFMFFGISILEDSGYLARVAYMLDRVFRIFGLHGNSVMAFIVSGGIAGGCAVPGVMATRTLRSPKERLATLLTAPFMNCGAKLPVFALLIAAFFADNEATVMFIITIISWGGALLAAKLLRSTVIKGAATPFVMELPPYRIPTFKGLLIHTWERTWQYIKKAGTVILGIAIILWAMMTFPALSDSRMAGFESQRATITAAALPETVRELESADEGNGLSAEARQLKDSLERIDLAEAEAGLRNSIVGRIGTALEGVTQWAGFDWRTNIALVGGFAAKEVVVSTLGTAYSLGEVDPEESESLSETLSVSPDWSPLAAWSLIIFTIFYAPCFVAVVCIAREAGSWKWGAFSMLFNTAVAFILAVLVYQIGTVLGIS